MGVCVCVCGGVSFLFSPFPLSTTHSQVPSLTTHSPRQKEILYPGLRQDLFCLTCSPKKGSSLFWAREGGGGQSGKNCIKMQNLMMLLCKQKTFPVATAKRSFRINSFDEKKTEEIIERIIRTYIHAQTTNINGVSSY